MFVIFLLSVTALAVYWTNYLRYALYARKQTRVTERKEKEKELVVAMSAEDRVWYQENMYLAKAGDIDSLTEYLTKRQQLALTLTS